MKKQTKSLSKIVAITGFWLAFSFSANAQNWLTAGNAVTTTPTLGITTTTGSFPLNIKNASTTQPINFWTNGTQKATILTNGNFGIGTATPSDVLDVRSLSSVNGSGLTISSLNNTGTGSQPGLVFKRYASGTLSTTSSIISGVLGSTISDLAFSTGSAATPNTLITRMLIDNTGKVGIGTTTPVNTLDVNGVVNTTTGFRVANAAAAATYLRGNGTNFVSSAIQVGDLPAGYVSNPTAIIGLTAVSGSATTAMRSDASPALSQAIVPTWTGTHTFSNATYSALFTGGNVGIGIATPSAPLEVESWTNSTLAIFDKHGANAQAPAIEIQSNGTTGLKFSHSNYFYDAWIDHNYAQAQNLIFALKGVEKMRIQNDGKMGIGTTYIPSGYLLAVQGKIIAEEVLVKLRANWPDYVFKKEYKMKTLSEVEEFVKSNQHLPGVPSAKEIDKGGVSLGEMSTKQMEKIEELTLYMIEMNKEIQNLKAENEKLKASIKK